MKQQAPVKMHPTISYSQNISSSLILHCSCPTGYGSNQSQLAQWHQKVIPCSGLRLLVMVQN